MKKISWKKKNIHLKTTCLNSIFHNNNKQGSKLTFVPFQLNASASKQQ